MSTDVTDHAEKSRYEIHVDGTLAGFADYRVDGDRITFTHTEIDDAFEGRGLGSALSRGALDDVNGTGLKVLPECPFVARYIKRHPRPYLDLVPETERATYGL